MRRTLPKAPSLKSTVTSGMRWRMAVAISVAVNKKPPSPVIDSTGTSRRAQRGGEAVAQIVLIAGREKGPRPINRKGEASREAKLRHLVDENTIVRQLRTDRRKIRKLRHELGEALLHAGMAFLLLVGARRPAGIVRRQDVE